MTFYLSHRRRSWPRLLPLLLILLLLAACTKAVRDSEEFQVFQHRDALYFRGSPQTDGVDLVAQHLAADPSIRVLAIESYGGDIERGMDLGELVLEYGLDVRTFGIGCWSSCANYVFTAGQNKRIEPGAVVVWHGSAIQEHWAGRNAQRVHVREDLERLRERQAEFFSRLPVDERVTIVGQDLDCQCNWTLSIEDMRRFGVDNVETVEPYDESVAEGARVFRLRFLELPDDVFERIRPPRPGVPASS